MDAALLKIKPAIGRWVQVCCVLSLCVLSSTMLWAQGSAGQIEGTVRDEQGGVLPGTTLTLRNEGTGITRTLTTEGDGRFIFPALAPGRYTLRAELSGFGVHEVSDVTITIGLNLREDIVLKVQALAETVTIRGESPVVDTTKAEISGTVTQQQIESLPMNSRQYLSLALLVPGTTVDATRSFFATVNVGGSMTFNGTGNVVDGTINNWAEDGEPRQDLPEDAVEEFKVTNAGYKAEFGLATGGVVEVVTKSGGRTLRGTAFEYFRNKALNAQGVFEAVKPDYRRNQFGGSAGGPIVRDKVHFFGSFERTDTEEFYTVRTGQPQFYSSLEGTFPLPSTRNLYSARVDWQVEQLSVVLRPVSRRGRQEDVPGLRRRRRVGPRRRGAAPVGGARAHLAARRAAVERLPFPVRARGVLRVSRRHRDLEGDRRLSARARQPLDSHLQLPVADLRQQLRLHQPGEPLGVPRHLRTQPGRPRRQVRRRVQLHAVRVGRGRQLADLRHLHVFARPVLRSQRPGVNRRADRRRDLQRVDPVYDQPPDEVLRRLRAGRLADAGATSR